jgi:hypothetical protein
MTTSHNQLQLLLEICEDYFRHANPTTRDNIDTLLHQHGITGGTGWLIDMLSLTRLQLQTPAHTEPHNQP